MRIRSSGIAFAFISIVAGACADRATTTAPPLVGQPSSIVNGVPTGATFGNVGALLFDFDKDGVTGDDLVCTGSLIAPTVFLTAAHCVNFLPLGSQFYVSFSATMLPVPASIITATSYAFDSPGPQFADDLRDLAVVILPNGSTAGITPLKLPPAGFLDAQAAQGGLRDVLFVNVGYGVSTASTGIPQYTFDGVRRTSKSPFNALKPFWLGLLMNNNATGLGGDCFGDSGGPKFLDGRLDMAVATVTNGDAVCRATSWDYRLDTPSARAFLGKYVTLP
jgi:hypothetical protein